MPFGANFPIDQLIAQVSSVTIEELSAPSGAKPRKLTLLGPALPFKGAEWGSQLVMKTTWYPGNAAEGTQQVLVPIEMPSSWEGVWRRTQMGKAPSRLIDETGEESAIVDPHVLRETIEDIHRKAALLRVTWAVGGKIVVGDPRNDTQRDQDVKIVREGRMKEFVTPVDMATDIRWRWTFEWKSRGASQGRVANVSGNDDMTAAANALESSVLETMNALNAKMLQSNLNVLKSATAITLGQLESLANLPNALATQYTRKLQAAMSDIRHVADIARTFATAPISAYNTVLDFARNTQLIANSFVDTWGHMPAELMSTKTKLRDMQRANKYIAQVAESAQKNATAAFELAEAIKRTRATSQNRGAVAASQLPKVGDVIAVHVCKEGDTPVKLAQLYYKNPDQGVAILRANKMPWYTPKFRPGQIIVITVLDTRKLSV